MKITRPNNKSVLVVNGDIELIACIDTDPHPGWVTIGYVGGKDGILIDDSEWPAFVALVAEIDEIKRGKK